MNNPYEWQLETYSHNVPPDDMPELKENWRNNMLLALLQSVAYKYGYEQGKADKMPSCLE